MKTVKTSLNFKGITYLTRRENQTPTGVKGQTLTMFAEDRRRGGGRGGGGGAGAYAGRLTTKPQGEDPHSLLLPSCPLPSAHVGGNKCASGTRSSPT